MVRSRQVPTDENDHIGQDLKRQRKPFRRASVANSGAQRSQNAHWHQQETTLRQEDNSICFQTHIFICLIETAISFRDSSLFLDSCPLMDDAAVPLLSVGPAM